MPSGADRRATRGQDALEPDALPVLQGAIPRREQVYTLLEEAILDGVIPAGAHLREDDVAKRLGVSRNPVREALQGLVHQGFAEHVPGKGVFVRSPSIQEVEEVFHVRALLESESARLAASRISNADLGRLEDVLERGKHAVAAKDVRRLLELNEQFHAMIVTVSGNTVMAKMMQTLQRRIRWYFSSVVVLRSADSWDQHAEIVRALREADGESAARHMAAHVEQTWRTIQERHRSSGASG